MAINYKEVMELYQKALVSEMGPHLEHAFFQMKEHVNRVVPGANTEIGDYVDLLVLRYLFKRAFRGVIWKYLRAKGYHNGLDRLKVDYTVQTTTGRLLYRVGEHFADNEAHFLLLYLCEVSGVDPDWIFESNR